MAIYNPDKWVILKLSPSGDPAKYFYRILGGWFGGYLYGDSWRLNSGVESYELYKKDAEGVPHKILFKGASGSIYDCWIDAEGMTGLMLQVFSQWVEHYGAEVVTRVTLKEFLEEMSGSTPNE